MTAGVGEGDADGAGVATRVGEWLIVRSAGAAGDTATAAGENPSPLFTSTTSGIVETTTGEETSEIATPSTGEATPGIAAPSTGEVTSGVAAPSTIETTSGIGVISTGGTTSSSRFWKAVVGAILKETDLPVSRSAPSLEMVSTWI